MEPRQVLVLQHAAPEHLGTLEPALRAAGLRPVYIRLHAGEPMPDEPAGAAALIVLGGPMGVYQREAHPHLAGEMRLIARALERDLPVLGICLGAQLLAAVLGSPVWAGARKEIGWAPVTLSSAAATDPLFARAPRSFQAFHWHGDIFALPAGALPLARSEMTELQAFRYGRRAWGLLFHLEVTEAMVRGMVTTFGHELASTGMAPATVLADLTARVAALNEVASDLFERWVGLVGEAR